MICVDCSRPAQEGRTRCELCLERARMRARMWYQNNKGRVAEEARTRYWRNGGSLPHNLSRYSLTPGEYEDLLLSQNGVCAICGEPETVVQNGKVKSLSVDHDHATGRVRGLLCNNCNRAIGMLKDDSRVLRAAAMYLEAAVAPLEAVS